MAILEIVLIGIGLSMDAFAVSVCKGLAMTKINKKQVLALGLFFGGFQAIMPLLGFFLGDFFYDYISKFGPWISFVLLVIIGFNMAREGYVERNDCGCDTEMDKPLPFMELLLLAIATSIDAFAVGVTFSLMQVSIFSSVIIIGCTTLIISIAGALIGFFAGGKYRTPARIIGGGVLIFLGVRILLTSFMV